MKISGNTILITGGTSGIGRALAESLHAKGNQVIIAGRRQELLDEITAAHEGMVGIAVDVADSKAVQGLAAEVLRRFPTLNVLINNAGMARPESYAADHVDATEALDVLRVNVGSVIELTAALLPQLRSQPASTVMVTTSGLAFVPYPKSPTYSGTKAFLHNWMDALRFQLRETSVEVLELAPPYVQTEFGGPQQAVDPRAMPLQAFNDEVMALLEAKDHPRGEILVENVKPLRWAEKNGTYDQMLEMFGKF